MIRKAVAVLALAVLGLALWNLIGQTRGLEVTRTTHAGSPVTTWHLPGAPPGPTVVIAHGFAGSEALMAPFATTLARAGYLAVTYDALGHGRHPAPLGGDVATVEGATAALLAQLAEIAAFARAHPASDGRLALLGHSMASDIVVRGAIADPGVAATVAVSLFSPAVTAEAPRNLLVVTGALEAGLTDEALRVAGLAAGAPAAPFTTAGSFAEGTARRAVLSPGVEHVGVLYSATSLAEATAWLDAAFARPAAPPVPDRRGVWLLAWFPATAALAWALAPLLPRLAPAVPRAAPRRGAFFAALVLPALIAPVLAQSLPEGLLPVPVADYLSVHFLLYGALTGLVLWRLGWTGPGRLGGRGLAASLAFTAFALVVLYLPIDRFVTAFLPPPHRLALLATLCLGLLPYFIADEMLTRAPEAPRGAYALSKLAFLASLALALAIDPSRLFFLVLILPVMLLFFLLFGLFSTWAFRATGAPLPSALALALLFAWAIATTFPILGMT